MPEQTPADWYPDAFGRYERRYWDGSQWTHHVTSRGRQDVDPPVHRSPVPVPNAGHTPAAWYPDPFGRHERRYWDGGRWTDHVASRGRQQTEGAVGAPPVPAGVYGSKKVQAQVRRSGVPQPAQSTEAAIFTEPVLVVNQKAKLFGLNAEYLVYDQNGLKIGAVREVDQRLLKKAVGAGGQHATHRFQVVDAHGRVLIALTRPATFLKSKMTVVGANGTHGEIQQKNTGIIRNVRFALVSGGQTLGFINAESYRAWDFNIQDANGTEIARITKTWAGWAKERFTKADNYVVQIHRPLQEPLRSLVIAAALAIDTALKQGTQTSGTGSFRRYE